jgi:hypothetical protein
VCHDELSVLTAEDTSVGVATHQLVAAASRELDESPPWGRLVDEEFLTLVGKRTRVCGEEEAQQDQIAVRSRRLSIPAQELRLVGRRTATTYALTAGSPMVEEEGGPRVLRNLRTDAEFAASGDVREHDVDVFVVGQLVVEIGI